MRPLPRSILPGASLAAQGLLASHGVAAMIEVPQEHDLLGAGEHGTNPQLPALRVEV